MVTESTLLASSSKQTSTLVALRNPFLLIPMVLTITEGHSSAERSRFAHLAALIVGIGLIGAPLAASAISGDLEISRASLHIAGLLVTGMAIEVLGLGLKGIFPVRAR